MESKKISFGFTKISSVKQNIVKSNPQNVEMIDCLENHTIKIVGKSDEVDPPPKLVIPLQPSKSSKLVSQQPLLLTEDNEMINTNTPLDTPVPAKNMTIEEQAAIEILANLKYLDRIEKVDRKLELPLAANALSDDNLAKESTLRDYDDIPIAEFGLAMLRGMGYKDEPKKSTPELEADMYPVPRPKGMGLGADSMMKLSASTTQSTKRDETLIIKLNAFVKIKSGKYANSYGQINGLDEGSGRVFVKFAIGGHCESINEYMVQPVSKDEYGKFAKVLNSESYNSYTDKFAESQHNAAAKSDNRDSSESKEIVKQTRRSTESRDRSSSEDRARSSRREFNGARYHKDKSTSEERSKSSHRDTYEYKNGRNRGNSSDRSKDLHRHSRSENRRDKSTGRRSRSRRDKSEHKNYREESSAIEGRHRSRRGKDKYKDSSDETSGAEGRHRSRRDKYKYKDSSDESSGAEGRRRDKDKGRNKSERSDKQDKHSYRDRSDARYSRDRSRGRGKIDHSYRDAYKYGSNRDRSGYKRRNDYSRDRYFRSDYRSESRGRNRSSYRS